MATNLQLVGGGPRPTTRLNVNLPSSEHRLLKALAREHHLQMTDLVRIGLGIIEDVLQDQPKGHRLFAVNGKNQLVKEYMIPGTQRFTRAETEPETATTTASQLEDGKLVPAH